MLHDFKWKTALIIFLTIVLAILMTGAGYAYYMYGVAAENLKKMNEQYIEDTGEKQDFKRSAAAKEPITIFIAGIADRPNEAALADVIMGVSINPSDSSLLLFHIPRDTQVSIPGRADKEKINHAYSYGGTRLLKETAEQQLNHKFDFVIEVNMEGFVQLVDALGGVEVNNNFAFSQNNVDNTKTHHFNEGKVELDGERALHYVRMRKSDPRGDLGRNERQKQIFTALLQKSLSMENLLFSKDMLEILGENVKTNVTISNLRMLVTDYRSALKNIHTFEMEGKNETLDGVSYYIVSEKEWLKTSLRLQKHQKKYQ